MLTAVQIEELTAEWLPLETGFPTGRRGAPRHPDVTLEFTVVAVVAVENKFTEHLSQSRRGKSDFAAVYFPPGRRLWASAELRKCHKVAEGQQGNETT